MTLWFLLLGAIFLVVLLYVGKGYWAWVSALANSSPRLSWAANFRSRSSSGFSFSSWFCASTSKAASAKRWDGR